MSAHPQSKPKRKDSTSHSLLQRRFFILSQYFSYPVKSYFNYIQSVMKLEYLSELAFSMWYIFNFMMMRQWKD
ncbi:hypothetical protein TrispH2_006062 [Trichoplax sp. H2]|nr:hypothetical protein TrispH2_006062 [Trichoplax sp. H2]|eukprot:RDD43143.1 hypothetical protein TrispH2_006062 [Trichoplax sp. H2]